MIRSLSMQNFKSWRRLDDMRLAPITVLFGANSSGKTSILQLLLLLKQTVESADRSLALDFGGENDIVNLGTIFDVLYRHERSVPIGWNIAWDLPVPLEVHDVSRPSSKPLLSGQLALRGSVKVSDEDQPVMNGLIYAFSSAEFRLIEQADGEFSLDVAPEGRFRLKRQRGRPWPLPGPVKCYRFPDQARAVFTNADFLSDFELAFESLMKQLLYLGPVRDDPRRQYVWGGSQPQGVGQWGERTVDALLAMRARGEKIKAVGRRPVPFETYVAKKLKSLGLIEDFAVEEVKKGTNLYQVRVRGAAGGTDVLLTDVGFGLSQILPVMVLAYSAVKGSTVIFEQPEIHLHPAVQAGLADILIDAVRVRGTQIIVESHSEHFLQRLQRRVAEEQVPAEDVALYFCEQEAGESRLVPLEMNDLGYIVNWPKGFFGDPLGEAVAMTKAAQRRAQTA